MIQEIVSSWSSSTYACMCPHEHTHTSTFQVIQHYVSSVAALVCLLPLGVVVAPLELSRRAIVWVMDPGPQGFTRIAEDSSLWRTADLARTHFAPDLPMGVATSHYQYGGAAIHPTSQWNTDLIPQGSSTQQTLAEITRGGSDIWDRPDQVIHTLQEMHANSFRLSVPETLWPQADGSIDRAAYGRFREILQRLQDNGIRVVLTCHHFSHPQEIEEAGGFFEETNCDRFVQLCQRLYDEYGDLVDEWCTINEPAVYASSAFMRGVFPPCVVDFSKMGRMMIQLIKMHNRVFCALKAKAAAQERDIVVGFSHQQITFQPEHWWNPLTQLVCTIMTHIMSNAYLEFYRSGTFHIQIPFMLNMKYEDPDFCANNGYLDVMQLQCYTRPLIGTWPIDSTCYPHEIMTNMPFRMDPAALYEALKHVHTMTGKPITVTEFGMATHDHEIKRLFMVRALYAISEAHREGVPLRGIHAWSFLGGNRAVYHEWDMDPVEQDFGLCAHNNEEGGTHHLRPAAIALRDVIDRTRDVAALAVA